MKVAQELIIKVYEPLWRKQRCLYIIFYLIRTCIWNNKARNYPLLKTTVLTVLFFRLDRHSYLRKPVLFFSCSSLRLFIRSGFSFKMGIPLMGHAVYVYIYIYICYWTEITCKFVYIYIFTVTRPTKLKCFF